MRIAETLHHQSQFRKRDLRLRQVVGGLGLGIEGLAANIGNHSDNFAHRRFLVLLGADAGLDPPAYWIFAREELAHETFRDNDYRHRGVLVAILKISPLDNPDAHGAEVIRHDDEHVAGRLIFTGYRPAFDLK